MAEETVEVRPITVARCEVSIERLQLSLAKGDYQRAIAILHAAHEFGQTDERRPLLPATLWSDLSACLQHHHGNSEVLDQLLAALRDFSEATIPVHSIHKPYDTDRVSRLLVLVADTLPEWRSFHLLAELGMSFDESAEQYYVPWNASQEYNQWFQEQRERYLRGHYPYKQRRQRGIDIELEASDRAKHYREMALAIESGKFAKAVRLRKTTGAHLAGLNMGARDTDAPAPGTVWHKLGSGLQVVALSKGEKSAAEFLEKWLPQLLQQCADDGLHLDNLNDKRINGGRFLLGLGRLQAFGVDHLEPFEVVGLLDLPDETMEKLRSNLAGAGDLGAAGYQAMVQYRRRKAAKKAEAVVTRRSRPLRKPGL